jgi:polysaccharide export outer membrane protein
MRKLISPRLILLALLGSLMMLSSCRLLNPNIMLHADRNYQFDTLANDTTIAKEYRLGPNDIIEFRLFANDGFKLIDIVNTGGNSNTGTGILRQNFEYTLDNQGVVKLPILGNESLRGMTIREAEAHLQQRYSQYYVEPFVMIKVNNKRIIVFPGEPGQAKVIQLQNNNTTVIEALALAGGIGGDGKAYDVKLIRSTNDPTKPAKVYKLDLSNITPGLDQGRTIVQSGDIIYVEPRRRVATRTLREIAPVFSLFTSLVTFYFLVTKLL